MDKAIQMIKDSGYNKVMPLSFRTVLSLRGERGLLYGVRDDTLCLTKTCNGVKRGVRYFFAEEKQRNLLCLMQVAPNEQNLPELHVIAYKAKVSV